jgi:pimeloyl-ACP methyl ester carboxylesterase
MAKPQIIHSLVRVGIILAITYAIFALLVFLGQRRILYFPSKRPLDRLVTQARQQSLEPWRNQSGDLIGWKHTQDANGPRVLILQGNAGCAVDRACYIQGLTTAGFKEIYILEYPGYGARPGAPSQQTLFDAATEALTLLTKNGPVHLVGESLGTGVAAYLAGQNPKTVTAILMIAPYHNLTDVAQSTMPILPVGLMLRDRYPAARYLQNYHGPVAVLLAGDDTVVPNPFGRKLYDTYAGPKKLWLIPHAGHNDVFLRPADWWRQLAEFWRESSESAH